MFSLIPRGLGSTYTDFLYLYVLWSPWLGIFCFQKISPSVYSGFHIDIKPACRGGGTSSKDNARELCSRSQPSRLAPRWSSRPAGSPARRLWQQLRTAGQHRQGGCARHRAQPVRHARRDLRRGSAQRVPGLPGASQW